MRNGPPLAYSLPAFHSDGYRGAAEWLEALRELGFEWVTFHPTYPVSGDTALTIGPGSAISEAIDAARQLGFRIRLEPHLDWVSTLSGGPYRWRRDMVFSPLGTYLDEVMRPLAELQPDELTLGSELDLCAFEHPEEWMELAERMRPFGSRLGHKLNHDWERADGVRYAWWPGTKKRLEQYLTTLDYQALSWYVPDRRPLTEGWTIGEIGLGSSDVTRPWHFDATTFQTSAELEIRKQWYLETLAWLKEQANAGAACFWTAGHFDVLGIMQPEWKDEAIVEAVRAYNQASP